MSSKPAIQLTNISKNYRMYDKPSDRLFESLPLFKPRHTAFKALESISFEIAKGEVIGIVGRNGAGKSTLLQIICNTLQPTSGEIVVNGRIAALLELGAGFNPEFTGKENIWMNASILGMTEKEIAQKYDDIVNFSEIGSAINQPVKTYSSGMFVRLAFSVAIHVSPDILIIDEALSVGDGAFARKSFDAIMRLKEQGATILFCSHSLYQVEALCEKAIWIDKGEMKIMGTSAEVVLQYQSFLDSQSSLAMPLAIEEGKPEAIDNNTLNLKLPHILSVKLNRSQIPVAESVPSIQGLLSEHDDLFIKIRLSVPKNFPAPAIGVLISNSSNVEVCSFSTKIDGYQLTNENQLLTLRVPKIPLLKGEYFIDVFLLCEKAIHVYEHLTRVCSFTVNQNHIEIGLIRLDRSWVSQVER